MEIINTINNNANVRKLATIAKILNIEPIEGADNLELATVRGWKVVVKKGEFVSGDLCVYIEVDSVLPDGLAPELLAKWKELQKQLSKEKDEVMKGVIKGTMQGIVKSNIRPEFEFLRDKKFRIKTREIFGQISQGICFPLDILCDGTQWYEIVDSKCWFHIEDQSVTISQELSEDTDVTEILGVTQYVAPENTSLDGVQKGDLAQIGILVSDEERIENLDKKYDMLREHNYYVTEKLDGTSISCYLKDDVFGVCGRNIDYKRPEGNESVNLYWRTALRMNIEDKMRKYSLREGIFNYVIQGELVGEGIQGNIYGLVGKTICFYNAYDIDTNQYLPYEWFIEMIDEMGLNTVPILDADFELPENLTDLLIEADNAKTVFGINHDQLVEGHVYVSKGINLTTYKVLRSTFNRISFKAKSRTYDKSKK